MTDRIAEFLAECGDRAAERARQVVMVGLGQLSYEHTESPIEQLMLMALYLSDLHYGRNSDVWGHSIAHSSNFIRQHCENTKHKCGVFIYPQMPVLEYRVDFLIGAMTAPDAVPHWVVVECDGHDYHERTAAQAEHDRARDRAMTAAGYRVFRFTGREIWRNPQACADEVLRYLRPYRFGVSA
jgi:very-short-patch-repair endonuclease